MNWKRNVLVFVILGAVLALLGWGASALVRAWVHQTDARHRAEFVADSLLKTKLADSLSRARSQAIADSFKEAAREHAVEAAKASAAAVRANRLLRVASDSAKRLSAKLDSVEADTTRPRPTTDDYRTAWLAERAVNIQATATIAALARDTTALHEQLVDERHRGDSLQVALSGAVTRISALTSGLDTLRQTTRCRLLGFLPVCLSPTVAFLAGSGLTGATALVVSALH